MSSQNFLESLEPRIAPAVIINAGPDNQGGIGYTDSPFTNTAKSSDEGIKGIFSAAPVGPDGNNDYYYLTLKAGDILNVFNSSPGAGYQQFVKITAGEALAFFHDSNNDGLVSVDELTGLSVGAKSKITVNGSVDGDVVANYNSSTSLISANTLISESQTIAGLEVSGGINGRVIAGGSITGVSIVSNVERIATGTAAIADSANVPGAFYTYDFGGTGSGAVGDVTFTANSFTQAAKKAGSSISNVTVGTLNDAAAPGGYGAVIASNGGAGGAGGSLTNINVIADTDGFNILAGNGGDTGGGATTGGAGGKLSNIRVVGPAVLDATDNDLITIRAGDGGDGTTTGKAGAGGTVGTVYVGYELPTGKTIQRSINLLKDDVLISGGDGGVGKTAGSGGAVQNIYVATSTLNGAGDELVVQGGDGGSDNNAAAGKGGVGGSLTNINVRNFNDTLLAQTATIVVEGGAGGDGGTAGTGGIGGSIKTANLLGFDFVLGGGNGASGQVKGGNGGLISDVTFENNGNVIPMQVLATGGNGGNAEKGLGGIGGNVVNLLASTIDVGAGNLVVTAGNGGSSTNATGGKGGILSNVNFVDDIDDMGNAGAATFTSGAGGDGGKKGGVGGDILDLSINGLGFGATVTAGAGGSATTSGTGGNGGSIKDSGVSVSQLGANNPVTMNAGNGGDAALKGKAGNGGSILSSNANADGAVAIAAGVGGAAGTGATGAGGSITSVGLASDGSGVTAIAGDAGNAATATKGANGGSLTNISVSALTYVTILGGDGTGGGSGGNLTTIAFADPEVSGPLLGSVNIVAGDGSTNGTVAGKGGSIETLNGYASIYNTADPAVATLIKAGDGASGSKKGGDGGSVSDVYVAGGTFYSQFLTPTVQTYTYGNMTIWAGEGGASTQSGAGGKGGSVTGVSLAQGIGIEQVEVLPGQYDYVETLVSVKLDNLVAGDGGDSASGKGGLGGSITNIYSLGDIGTRSGKAYGFDSTDASTYYNRMGGIFAGLGGEGSKGAGAAGNVISVTANAIASIVAGTDLTKVGFVSKVDSVFLNGNGNNDPEADADGRYLNWNQAVFVGSIAGDPTDVDSDVYKTAGGVAWSPGQTWNLDTTQPLDGLIAALSLTTKRNFSPMAFLTLDSSGATQFTGVRVP